MRPNLKKYFKIGNNIKRESINNIQTYKSTYQYGSKERIKE